MQSIGFEWVGRQIGVRAKRGIVRKGRFDGLEMLRIFRKLRGNRGIFGIFGGEWRENEGGAAPPGTRVIGVRMKGSFAVGYSPVHSRALSARARHLWVHVPPLGTGSEVRFGLGAGLPLKR